MNTGYKYVVADSIQKVSSDWQSVANSDVFWSIAFHEAIEYAPPLDVRPYYLIIKDHDKPVGILYYQVKHLKLKDALKLDSGAGSWAKQMIINRVNFYSMVCGNSMVTGQYGYRFLEDIPKSERFTLVQQATDYMVSYLQDTHSIKVGPIIFKDYYNEQVVDHCPKEGCHRFKVQPSMNFEIHPEWNTFDDYLASMKTKYRTRAKRAQKKLTGIQVIPLEIETLKLYKSQIHSLYLYVARQASFNLFYLNEDYFIALKKFLGDKIKFLGYINGEELVGFSTMILNNGNLDAHFLGYNPAYNQSHQLYLNMLYHMIEHGVDHKLNRIYMSRTALEIKSSTGAVSHEMYCYLTHRQSLYRRLLPHILKYLVPDDDWVPRSPFKDVPDDESNDT